MPSSFMGLYVQRNALLISQKALDITGNNISNINTKGYSRQRVDICSIANAKNTLGYNTSVALAGMGSDTIGVAQIRNRLLDRKVRVYSGDLCNVGVKVNTLSDIEDIFDSIEADSGDIESSFAAIVNRLKAALQSYSADHADRSEMANITKNAAESLAQAIRNYNLKLNDVSNQTLKDARSTVDRINAIFAEMGNLNKQIKDSYISMGYITATQGNYQVQGDYGPLELKDKMNNLLDELSQYGNIDFHEEDDGTFTVKFANQTVVYGKYYAQMATTEISPSPTELAFVITSSTQLDADGNPVLDEYGKPLNGLYDKDTWYEMNLAGKTSGDSSELIRKILRGETEGMEDLKEIKGMFDTIVDVTGKDVHGKQYISSGSLRGFLDMYNGRGLFTDNSDKSIYQSINDRLALANKYLGMLDDIDTLEPEEIDNISDLLKETIGAELKYNEKTNNYTVTVNGVTLYDKNAGINEAGNLQVINPDSPNRSNAQIVVGDKIIRTIALNDQKGIEYYRDMLNAYVKTITDEFNKVYSKVPNPKYDPDDPDSTEPEFLDPIKLFEYSNEEGDFDFRSAASNFRISDEWIRDPEIVANPSGENRFGELDNTYIHRLLALFESDLEYGDGYEDMFGEGNGHHIHLKFPIDEFVSHINGEVGTHLESETGIYDATDIMLTSEEKLRSEAMDVSMNEEGINMMNYQKWYNAISRMISTLDEALDKLINQTGLVGLR